MNASSIKNFFDENGSSICAGIGIAGFISAIAIAIKETPKALANIELYKDKLQKDSLTPKEVVKATWKNYIFVVCLAIVSSGAIIFGNTTQNKKTALLAAALGHSENMLEALKESLKENIPSKEEVKKIEDNARKKFLDKTRESDEDTSTTSSYSIENIGEKYLFFDPISKQYFYSNINDVNNYKNQLNECLNSDDFYSINDWLDFLGCQHVYTGYEQGWDRSKGLVDIQFNPVIKNNKPVIFLEYSRMPKETYNRF